MMALEPVLQPLNELGEIPVWCERRGRLFWTDIRACRLHSFDPDTGTAETFKVPDWAGAFALTETDELLLALRKSLVFHDLQTESFRLLDTFEPGLPNNRSNDGRVDRQGRFWVGTLNNAERIPTGNLYCVARDTIAFKRDVIIVPNALAWSPDGQTMYFADSWIGDIWAYDFDPGTGATSNERVFLAKDALPGIPDGATIDCQGCMWIARYGAGQVARITPDGKVDQLVQCDTMQLTACTLGGSDFRDLYVTSARQRMSSEQLKAEPNAGALFHMRVATPGLPEPRYRMI